ncbi:DUF3015 family protein [Vibrio ostreicida]|uniref:DUF3015 family protein n=1 Tax=Vibrio ostreicida TaxID=526588 RepID=A0ABT8BVX3_9VIBR|nr:DUF3015 family protein [Vibrio ostreicida]MDN3610238.1 DUF3015 family protein [Vibrio ostreicida]NPD07744.1 DUF3015 family protein [Vibrio ostreicida]
MKKLTLLAAVAGTFLTGHAMAESNKDDINPWTQCGIGAMIFEDTAPAAAISNIIWDLGTTAVTSRISSEESCAGSKVKTAQFIQDNYDQVLEETSQGSGEHLVAMLEMLDVNSADQPQVIASVRAQVAENVVADQASPQAYYHAVIASL